MDIYSVLIGILVLDAVLFMSLFVIAYYLHFGYKCIEQLVDSRLTRTAFELGNIEIKTSLQEFRQQTLEPLGELIGQIKLSTAQAENAEFDAAHDTDIPEDASGDIALTIYSTHQLVEAFKNDLITQVRLSREDYEELMATAESKNADFPQQLNDLRLTLTTLQTELAEFRRATGV